MDPDSPEPDARMVDPTRQDGQLTLRLRLFLSILLMGAAAAVLRPGPMTWGVDHLAYLDWPQGLAVVWYVAALVLVWSPAAPRAGVWLVDRAEPALLGRPWIAMAVVPAVGAAVFWLLRARTPLLGDGMLLSHLLGKGDLQHGFDFMAFHLHARLARLAGVEDAMAAQRLVAATSALTGAAYLAAAGWAARMLPRRPGEGVLLWVLLVLAAPLQLFMGYVECYAQLAVCLVLFGACVVRHLDGRGSLLAAAGWFAAALFWHLTALFLAPLLLAAVIHGRPDGRDLARRLAIAVWPSLLAVGAAMLLFSAAGLDLGAVADGFLASEDGRRLIRPLSGPTGLADLRLAKDAVNLVVLLAAVPTALLLATARRPWPGMVRLLAGVSVWLVVLVAVLDLKLGLARDWDLVAPHVVVVALAAFAAVRAIPRPAAPTGLVWVAALALAIPWFTLNADQDASLRRVAAATRDLPSYRRGMVLEDLGRWYRERGRLDEAAVAYRHATEACPRHGRFHLLLGQIRCRQGQYDLAVKPLRRALALDSDIPLIHRMLLLALSEVGRHEAALVHARALAGTSAEDVEVARAHGILAERTGRVEEAVQAYRRALRIDPGQPAVATHVGELELQLGWDAQAERSFRHALAHEEDAPTARLGLARAMWAQEMHAAAVQDGRLREIESLLEGLDLPASAAAEVAAWRRAITARRSLAAAAP